MLSRIAQGFTGDTIDVVSDEWCNRPRLTLDQDAEGKRAQAVGCEFVVQRCQRISEIARDRRVRAQIVHGRSALRDCAVAVIESCFEERRGLVSAIRQQHTRGLYAVDQALKTLKQRIVELAS